MPARLDHLELDTHPDFEHEHPHYDAEDLMEVRDGFAALEDRMVRQGEGILLPPQAPRVSAGCDADDDNHGDDKHDHYVDHDDEHHDDGHWNIQHEHRDNKHSNYKYCNQFHRHQQHQHGYDNDNINACLGEGEGGHRDGRAARKNSPAPAVAALVQPVADGTASHRPAAAAHGHARTVDGAASSDSGAAMDDCALGNGGHNRGGEDAGRAATCAGVRCAAGRCVRLQGWVAAL
mmetsp:Transcript_37307/g.74285  ORF Transcript_37307/g.74285 Transcript_37307/m.74285 type:complete len:234 (-) Transcript_37307:367-1068(-)